MAARRARKVKKRQRPPTFEEQARRSEFQALAKHVRENPLLYAAGAAFVVVCGLAGALYRFNEIAKEQTVASQYARALETEDASLRAAELERLAETKSALAAEVLYMMGAAASEAGDANKAKAAFQRVRAKHPESPFAPDAVEGLAYIAEDRQDHQTALSLYREILDKWPTTLTALRQPFNIGRCQEQLNHPENAIAAYQEQVVLFRGSNVASDALAALERLAKSHPALFSEPDATEEEVASALDALESPAITVDVGITDSGLQEVSGPADLPADTSLGEDPLETPSEEATAIEEPAT